MGYAWSYELTTSRREDRGPEQWARRTLEGAPAPVRVLLVVGWRFGMLLRLGPLRPVPGRVLGWPVVERTPESVRVAVAGPLFDAQNTVEVAGEVVRWTTTVQYHNALGRLLWAIAAAVHQRSLPLLLKRAAREGGSAGV